RGDGIFSLNAVENSGGVPNELAMNAGPVLALPDKETEEIRDYLLTKIGEKQEVITEHSNKNHQQFEKWLSAQTNGTAIVKAVKEATVSHITFDDMEDGQASDLTPGSNKATYWGEIRSVPGIRGKAVRSNADGQFVSDGKRAIFERNEPFTVSFWIQSPKAFSEAHVLYNGNDRIQGYRGWDVVMDKGHLHFRLNHAHPYQSIDIRTTQKIPLNTWVHFVWTYNGSSQAEGMHIFRNGEADEVEIMRNHLYRSTKPYLIPAATVYKPYKGIIIGNRHYDQDFTGGLLDEIRVLNNEADPITARYLYDESNGELVFETALENDPSLIKPFYDRFVDPELDKQRNELRKLQAREIRTIDTVQEIMVMGDLENERPTYILDRGIYDAHGRPVSRNVPESILPWPEELPKNRHGLGQWLIHPDHPLTSRVAVNQFWYLIFGRGLVETVEDFGSQGALPSHPELLDWLAVDFQQNGWDLKRLIKQMICSATYRQSSVVRPELDDIDPDNILLARGPRYRRSAEMIRDNILAASGLLESKIGGPSAFPYQPDGLWKEVMTHTFFPEYEIDYEDGLYRRSLYTFWKRNMPPPSMLIFDASTRAECQVRRQRSSSPLQALVLLNDPQIIEGCRVLAEKVWHDGKGDPDLALSTTFRILTSRAPSEKEKTLLLRQYEDELKHFQQHAADGLAYLDVGHRPADPDLPAAELAALARVTNTILNSTESFYKN
ncbi:MAG: DUF1553 domain-containing protein, partial [Saprospiraceae bacterium]|nr:DUF1553 domain-containing protein [Saprospiraceae bacterium]